MAVSAGVQAVLDILADVKDPELPALDVVELGIVRNVEITGNDVRVDITPTYTGCPAIEMIERDIIEAIRSSGFDEVAVRTVYSPAWTSDWITEAGREKLRDAGIAPPHLSRPESSSTSPLQELITLKRAPAVTECPFCSSENTTERSRFGSTACKAIHFCNDCKQPFDYFKSF